MYEISHLEHDFDTVSSEEEPVNTKEIDKQLELVTQLQGRLENEEKKLFFLMKEEQIFTIKQTAAYG